jgi:hypothetical protein
MGSLRILLVQGLSTADMRPRMRYSVNMRRLLVLVVVVVAGCTSTWERHQTQLAEAEAHGDYHEAVSEQRWLIDNAFVLGPRSEHNFEADARRYRHLAKLAAKTGNYRLAVDSLKQALNLDPSHAAAVQAQLDALPLTPSERAKLDSEFSWNIAALRPGDEGRPPAVEENLCWSYRVREVRVTHVRTVSTEDGMQRQATYDARAWTFRRWMGHRRRHRDGMGQRAEPTALPSNHRRERSLLHGRQGPALPSRRVARTVRCEQRHHLRCRAVAHRGARCISLKVSRCDTE